MRAAGYPYDSSRGKVALTRTSQELEHLSRMDVKRIQYTERFKEYRTISYFLA